MTQASHQTVRLSQGKHRDPDHGACVMELSSMLAGEAFSDRPRCVDPVIAAPRRSTPRTAVPAGSVAIAGGQTGVYPAVTPGGWNIIGRTPVAPYDASRPEPFLFRPGDRVRFHRVDSL